MSAPPPSPPALLQSRLQEFNLLPSRSLHAERTALLLMPPAADPAVAALANQPAVERALHRRWSAQLLGQLGEHARPVLDLSHAALPLALAAPAQLARLARDAGVTLLGGYLRRTIARDAVRDARAALGDAGLEWARHGAASLHPGVADAEPWAAHGLGPAADLLGAGVIAQAWEDAPEPIRLRANWKLSPAAVDSASVRSASGLDAPAARQLCLQLLARLDSAWLSSFPATL